MRGGTVEDLTIRYVKIREDLVLKVAVDRYDMETKPDTAYLSAQVVGVLVSKDQLSMFENGE